jgi:hypothetical protein
MASNPAVNATVAANINNILTTTALNTNSSKDLKNVFGAIAKTAYATNGISGTNVSADH